MLYHLDFPKDLIPRAAPVHLQSVVLSPKCHSLVSALLAAGRVELADQVRNRLLVLAG